MALTFALPQLIALNDNRLTDHNRTELSVEVERIEKSTRMANGTMRKYFIADKRKFSTSWSMLPSDSQFAVDGFWAADQIETFYNQNSGPVTLKLKYSNQYPEIYTVVISSFSKTLRKRGKFDFFDVSLSMEEV